MIEYKIITPPELVTVKLLWSNFFRRDPHWHFALEMGYVEIRLTKKNSRLEAYLNKKNWSFTKRQYKNNTPITRKYQKCFDSVYHGYAMLAMTLPPPPEGEYVNSYDGYRVMERCIHLAFNNIVWGLKFGNERNILWMILADRTYMAGFNKGTGLT